MYGVHIPNLGIAKNAPAVSRVFRYRGTSLARKRNPLGPYRRPMPRVVGESWGGGCFMGQVPLYELALCSVMVFGVHDPHHGIIKNVPAFHRAVRYRGTSLIKNAHSPRTPLES